MHTDGPHSHRSSVLLVQNVTTASEGGIVSSGFGSSDPSLDYRGVREALNNESKIPHTGVKLNGKTLGKNRTSEDHILKIPLHIKQERNLAMLCCIPFRILDILYTCRLWRTGLNLA